LKNGDNGKKFCGGDIRQMRHIITFQVWIFYSSIGHNKDDIQIYRALFCRSGGPV
jgi:hypothetical protein